MMSENSFIIVECRLRGGWLTQGKCAAAFVKHAPSGAIWKFTKEKADAKVICFVLFIKLSQSLEIAAAWHASLLQTLAAQRMSQRGWVSKFVSVSLSFVVQHARMGGKVHMQWLFGGQDLSPFQSTRTFPNSLESSWMSLAVSRQSVEICLWRVGKKKFWNENGKGHEMETRPRAHRDHLRVAEETCWPWPCNASLQPSVQLCI